MNWFRAYYRKGLSFLCHRELRKIGKGPYPHTREDLINWHDYMMLECLEPERDHILGIMVCTAKALEGEL